MRGKIGDKERIGHIMDAIMEIEAYTVGISFDQFIDNSMIRLAEVKSGSREFFILRDLSIDEAAAIRKKLNLN